MALAAGAIISAGPTQKPVMYRGTATPMRRPRVSCLPLLVFSTMPTYHIEMFEGRTAEHKKKLVEEITRVTVEVLGGSAESVDIIISDIKRENWATGGRLWSEPRS